MRCPCGHVLSTRYLVLIEDDTGDYHGAIWQASCICGRAYTVEVADDPDYPDD